MAFEVVVLGASGTYPTTKSACSGYLLRSTGTDVWVDAGPGTFLNLQRHADFLGLRALILSHLHLDHVLDLYPFYFAMRFRPTEPAGFEVYAPAGAEEHLAQLFRISPDPAWRDFGGYLKFHAIGDGSEVSIGPFRFRFAKSIHPVETLAMRIEADGRSLVYTSDTGPGDGIWALARDADLLIAEATLQASNHDLAEVHLTAEETGQLAAQAGVKRLVLTHIDPSLDPVESVALAKKHFSGEIVVATDHMVLEV